MSLSFLLILVFFLIVSYIIINVKSQGNIILGFWEHCKNCVAITLQKHTERSTENGASIVYSCALRGVYGYSFFTARNKSVIEIHRELCSCNRPIIYIDIQLPYTELTSLWISTADLFRAVKKQITAYVIQDATTCNSSSIFHKMFCTFLWSDCYTIFTVLPETQKLYPCNFTLIGSQNAEKKIRKLIFETTLI